MDLVGDVVSVDHEKDGGIPGYCLASFLLHIIGAK